MPLCQKNAGSRILGWVGEGSCGNQICVCCFFSQIGGSALSHCPWNLQLQLVSAAVLMTGSLRSAAPGLPAHDKQQAAHDSSKCFRLKKKKNRYTQIVFLLLSHDLNEVNQTCYPKPEGRTTETDACNLCNFRVHKVRKLQRAETFRS